MAAAVELIDYTTRLLERMGGAKRSHKPIKIPRPQPRHEPGTALAPAKHKRKPTAAEWKQILGGDSSTITVLPR